MRTNMLHEKKRKELQKRVRVITKHRNRLFNVKVYRSAFVFSYRQASAQEKKSSMTIKFK